MSERTDVSAGVAGVSAAADAVGHNPSARTYRYKKHLRVVPDGFEGCRVSIAAIGMWVKPLRKMDGPADGAPVPFVFETFLEDGVTVVSVTGRVRVDNNCKKKAFEIMATSDASSQDSFGCAEPGKSVHLGVPLSGTLFSQICLRITGYGGGTVDSSPIDVRPGSGSDCVVHIGTACHLRVHVETIAEMTVVTLLPVLELQNLLPCDATFVVQTATASSPAFMVSPGATTGFELGVDIDSTFTLRVTLEPSEHGHNIWTEGGKFVGEAEVDSAPHDNQLTLRQDAGGDSLALTVSFDTTNTCVVFTKHWLCNRTGRVLELQAAAARRAWAMRPQPGLGELCCADLRSETEVQISCEGDSFQSVDITKVHDEVVVFTGADGTPIPLYVSVDEAPFPFDRTTVVTVARERPHSGLVHVDGNHDGHADHEYHEHEKHRQARRRVDIEFEMPGLEISLIDMDSLPFWDRLSQRVKGFSEDAGFTPADWPRADMLGGPQFRLVLSNVSAKLQRGVGPWDVSIFCGALLPSICVR
eukprot:SAG11_NODE_1086_length_5931_cov_2.593450_1_plen_529_part_00